MWISTQSPGPGPAGLGLQHADVDPAGGALDVDQRQLARVALQHLDDLAGNSETHGVSPSDPRRPGPTGRVASRARTASAAGAPRPGPSRLSPIPSSRFAGAAADQVGRRQLAAQRRQAGQHGDRVHPVRVELPAEPLQVVRADLQTTSSPGRPRPGSASRAPGRGIRRAGRKPGACRGCRSRPAVRPRAAAARPRGGGPPRGRSRRRPGRDCRSRQQVPRLRARLSCRSHPHPGWCRGRAPGRPRDRSPRSPASGPPAARRPGTRWRPARCRPGRAAFISGSSTRPVAPATLAPSLVLSLWGSGSSLSRRPSYGGTASALRVGVVIPDV